MKPLFIPKLLLAQSVNWKLTAVSLLQTLFEQVWAANDYEIFKRMMIQKNLELQLQALEMIQQRYGITPQSFLPTDGDECLQTDEESQIMEEVIK
jgi:The ARF-like 2 binding protein BART.